MATGLLQRGDHAPEELVVAEALLLDNGVHGLLARGSGYHCSVAVSFVVVQHTGKQVHDPMVSGRD